MSGGSKSRQRKGLRCAICMSTDQVSEDYGPKTCSSCRQLYTDISFGQIDKPVTCVNGLNACLRLTNINKDCYYCRLEALYLVGFPLIDIEKIPTPKILLDKLIVAENFTLLDHNYCRNTYVSSPNNNTSQTKELLTEINISRSCCEVCNNKSSKRYCGVDICQPCLNYYDFVRNAARGAKRCVTGTRRCQINNGSQSVCEYCFLRKFLHCVRTKDNQDFERSTSICDQGQKQEVNVNGSLSKGGVKDVVVITIDSSEDEDEQTTKSGAQLSAAAGYCCFFYSFHNIGPGMITKKRHEDEQPIIPINVIYDILPTAKINDSLSTLNLNGSIDVELSPIQTIVSHNFEINMRVTMERTCPTSGQRPEDQDDCSIVASEMIITLHSYEFVVDRRPWLNKMLINNVNRTSGFIRHPGSMIAPEEDCD